MMGTIFLLNVHLVIGDVDHILRPEVPIESVMRSPSYESLYIKGCIWGLMSKFMYAVENDNYVTCIGMFTEKMNQMKYYNKPITFHQAMKKVKLILNKLNINKIILYFR